MMYKIYKLYFCLDLQLHIRELLFQSEWDYASLFYGNKVDTQQHKDDLILGDARWWSLILTVFQGFVIA